MKKTLLAFLMILGLTLGLVSSGWCYGKGTNFVGTDQAQLLNDIFNIKADFNTTTAAGNATWGGNMLSLGVANGGVSTMATATTVVPLTYGFVKNVCSTKNITVANGVAGQQLTIQAVDYTGTTTIIPATAVGWSNATQAVNGATLNIMYQDDVRGWYVLGAVNTTVNLKNAGQ